MLGIYRRAGTTNDLGAALLIDGRAPTRFGNIPPRVRATCARHHR